LSRVDHGVVRVLEGRSLLMGRVLLGEQGCLRVWVWWVEW